MYKVNIWSTFTGNMGCIVLYKLNRRVFIASTEVQL